MTNSNVKYRPDVTLRTPRRTLHPFPGLFYYSGFGYGNYYSTDGSVYWGTESEARAQAAQEGVECQYVDSLEGYQAVYLGD